MVDTHGTGKLAEPRMIQVIRALFDLTPAGIIRTLKLRRPIYLKTAAYGHFGREEDGFTWEELDRVNDIQQAVRHPHTKKLLRTRNNSLVAKVVAKKGPVKEVTKGLPRGLVKVTDGNPDGHSRSIRNPL